MINLNQLRVFYKVARTLSLSMAAKNLNVTQPAVSTQIKAFEEFCGLKLFRKKRGRVSLTNAGEILLIHASKLFNLEEELEHTLSDLRKFKEGHLRIGTTKTYARYLMPVMLTQFHKSYPSVIIDLDEGSSLEMIRSLLDRRNDFAIVAKVEEDQDIVFRPLLNEEAVWIVSPSNPLASVKRVTMKELAKQPIIMKELGSGTRRLLETLAVRERVELNVIMQTSNMEFIKELVKENKAISLVVRSCAEKAIVKGELSTARFHGSPLFMEIFLAYLRDQEPSRSVTDFLEFMTPVLALHKRPMGAVALLNSMTRLGKLS